MKSKNIVNRLSSEKHMLSVLIVIYCQNVNYFVLNNSYLHKLLIESYLFTSNVRDKPIIKRDK